MKDKQAGKEVGIALKVAVGSVNNFLPFFVVVTSYYTNLAIRDLPKQ